MGKRILVILLCVTIIATAFAGCNNGGTSSTESSAAPASSEASSEAPASSEEVVTEQGDGDITETEAGSGYTFPLEEPVTMTMFAILNGEVDLNDNIGFKKYEEMTNVHWEIQSAMGVDIQEKRNLLLASNQYPDVFFKSGMPVADLDKYGPQGMFVDLTDAIENHAPNFKKVLEDRPAIQQVITSEDGGIYSLPEVSQQLPVDNIAYMNTKWLENVGMEMPTNLDELYNVLVAFKEQDANGNGDPNDEIPYIFTGGDPNTNTFYFLLPYFGVNIDYGTKTTRKDGKLEYVMNSDVYKEYLAWNKKLYDEGLMYQNSFSTTNDQRQAIGMSGDTLGFMFEMGIFLSVGRERDSDWDGMNPFEQGVLPVSTGATPGTLVVTDSCEDPNLVVAWADYNYSEEGGILSWLGVEGETYILNADGTWEWNQGDFKDLTNLRQAAAIQGAANHPSIQPQLWFTGTTDANEKLLNQIRDRLVEQGAEPFPALKYTDADNKTVAAIKNDIDPYVLQYAAQVVTGQKDLDASWEEYVTTLENMGLSQMMEIYNTAFEKVK
ncbi:MAG: hypothetical protein ACK5LX_02245 [Oscillospiraceae bacterium]